MDLSPEMVCAIGDALHVLTVNSLAVAAGCRPTNAVHITDQEPMLALMYRNIALNDVEGRVVASVYDWGSDRPSVLPSTPDVVLAGV